MTVGAPRSAEQDGKKLGRPVGASGAETLRAIREQGARALRERGCAGMSLRDLAGQGHRVRLHVPVGRDWWPHAVRRVGENPRNAWLLARSAVGAA